MRSFALRHHIPKILSIRNAFKHSSNLVHKDSEKRMAFHVVYICWLEITATHCCSPLVFASYFLYQANSNNALSSNLTDTKWLVQSSGCIIRCQQRSGTVRREAPHRTSEYKVLLFWCDGKDMLPPPEEGFQARQGRRGALVGGGGSRESKLLRGLSETFYHLAWRSSTPTG